MLLFYIIIIISFLCNVIFLISAFTFFPCQKFSSALLMGLGGPDPPTKDGVPLHRISTDMLQL